MTRTLLAGWFSVPGGEATAGDLLAMELVRDDLESAGCAVDVVTNAGFPTETGWDDLEPERYDTLVLVCGPLHGDQLHAVVDRFPSARKIAVNVSVVDPSLADRFDVVLPRDDGERTNPDLTMARPPTPLPVIGVVRSHAQPEYAEALHERAHEAIRLLLASRPCATVDFDTRVHPGADPLDAHARDSAEVTSLAARMDVVVTTRLHGLVLSLAQGTPVLAIDPVAGGAKVARQARVLDWPALLIADALHAEELAEMLSWCLSAQARQRAQACAADARRRLEVVRAQLRDVVAAEPRAGSGG